MMVYALTSEVWYKQVDSRIWLRLYIRLWKKMHPKHCSSHCSHRLNQCRPCNSPLTLHGWSTSNMLPCATCMNAIRRTPLHFPTGLDGYHHIPFPRHSYRAIIPIPVRAAATTTQIIGRRPFCADGTFLIAAEPELEAEAPPPVGAAVTVPVPAVPA